MNKILLAAFVAISSLAIAPAAFPQTAAQSAKPSAQERTTTVNPAALQLKPEITAQHQRIQILLPAQTRQKLGRMVPDFERQIRASKKGADLRELPSRKFTNNSPTSRPSKPTSSPSPCSTTPTTTQKTPSATSPPMTSCNFKWQWTKSRSLNPFSPTC